MKPLQKEKEFLMSQKCLDSHSYKLPTFTAPDRVHTLLMLLHVHVVSRYSVSVECLHRRVQNSRAEPIFSLKEIRATTDLWYQSRRKPPHIQKTSCQFSVEKYLTRSSRKLTLFDLHLHLVGSIETTSPTCR